MNLYAITRRIPEPVKRPLRPPPRPSNGNGVAASSSAGKAMRAGGSAAHATRHRLAMNGAAERHTRSTAVWASAAPHPVHEGTLQESRDRFVVMAGPVTEIGSQYPQCGVTAA